MARPTLAPLIRRLRTLIGDDAGTSQVWADDDLQEALDEHRTDVRYQRLREDPTYAQGGAVSYLLFCAEDVNWDEAVSLVDADYSAVTPSEADYQRDRFTFTSEPDWPLYLTGSHYDLYGAAADILEAWAAKVKLEFAFAAGPQRFERQQQHALLLAQAQRYRRKQRPRCVSLVRGDVR